jgi:hypothetical protein
MTNMHKNKNGLFIPGAATKIKYWTPNGYRWRHGDDYQDQPPLIAGGSTPGQAFAFAFSTVVASTSLISLWTLSGDSETPHDLVEFSVSANYTASTSLFEIYYCSTGTAPVGSGATLTQVRGVPATGRTVAKVTITTEPATKVVIRRWLLNWPGGPYTFQFPLGRELGSYTSGTGAVLGLQVTNGAATSGTIYGHVEIEE